MAKQALTAGRSGYRTRRDERGKTSPGKSEDQPKSLAEAFAPKPDVVAHLEVIDQLTDAIGSNTQELADACARAHEELPPEDVDELKKLVRIGPAWFYKMAEIGSDLRQKDPKYAAHIPQHNRSLRYLLASKFKDNGELDAAISQGVLHPKAQRKSILAWWKRRHPEPMTEDVEPKAAAEPREIVQPAYAEIRFKEPVTSAEFDSVQEALRNLAELDGVEVSHNFNPTDLQHQRTMRAYQKALGTAKRKLVRWMIERELEHDLGTKPKNVTRAQWLERECGLSPEQYTVAHNASDDDLLRVLRTFNRDAEFAEVCRRAAEGCKPPANQVQLGLPIIIAETAPLLPTEVFTISSPPILPTNIDAAGHEGE